MDGKFKEHYCILIGYDLGSENQTLNSNQKGFLVCCPSKFLVIRGEDFKPYLMARRFYKTCITQVEANIEIKEVLQEEDQNIFYRLKAAINTEVIKSYRPTPHFEAALSAMIFSKKEIKWSSTEIRWVKNGDGVENIRQEISYQRENVHQDLFFLKSTDIFLYNVLHFLNSVNVCQQTNVGNCYEFSLLGLFDILKNNSDVSASVHYVATTEQGKNKNLSGDHVVLVIDDLVCDSWDGKIYPADKIDKFLGNYIFIEMNGACYNTIHKFNQVDYFLKEDSILNTQKLRDFFNCFISYSKKIKNIFLGRMQVYFSYLSASGILKLNKIEAQLLYKNYIQFKYEKIHCCDAVEDQMNFYLKLQSRLDEFDSEICSMVTGCAHLTDQKGDSFLHFTAEQGHFNMVEFLLHRPEVNVNLQNNEGNSPLHVAVMSENLNQKIVQELIKKGVDVGLKNKLGKTALEMIGSLPTTQLRQSIIKMLRDAHEIEDAAKRLIALSSRYTNTYSLFSANGSASITNAHTNVL